MILPCQFDPAPFDAALDTRPGSRANRRAVAAAKALCATCEVRDKCLTAWLDLFPDDPGVIAGTTWEDRHPGMRRPRVANDRPKTAIHQEDM